MRIEEIIRKKRDGGELDEAEINRIVSGLSNNTLPNEQAAAFAMAVFFRSMTENEISKLTIAMARSGDVIDWAGENLAGPVVDKHSTGGVGDKVSFALAPIAAACGCYVPMISGRGLGHSGGTLDKIESIPGYRVQPGIDEFKRVVRETGCAIIGQTGELAPADRKLYALRDITATIESVPLITASILSKKIAAGNQALVMDIKTGSGAFMPSLEAANTLAECIVATGNEAKLKTRALVTDMSEPLGKTAGNAVEIDEIVHYLTDKYREERLDTVIKSLCAEMLTSAGVEQNVETALTRIESAITSGRAAEIFAKMVAALGGPADFMEKHETYLPNAKYAAVVMPGKTGFLSEINTRRIGEAIVDLGGGRQRTDDRLDLSVGFTDIAPTGAAVGNERPLAIARAASKDALNKAIAAYSDACVISDTKPEARPLIYNTVA
ncbi:thymidine phosphorylase [Hyphococcus flavus]|uniref:Thymidine phosphorylase n=1 Tax=Hyphococcus flavus TaxID=1866326 RepID=A0AAE9Z9Y1_9PROT|nr:thymidine phosphorylase [Hyphococcus flavus]WDI30174.1 thymidine phosphorylase [Hyphococcus flavus]